jgi:hypothetical protein
MWLFSHLEPFRGPLDRLVVTTAVLAIASGCHPPIASEGDDPSGTGQSPEATETDPDNDGGWPPGMSVVCDLGPSHGLVGHWSGDEGLSDAAMTHDGFLVPLRPTGEYGAIERHPPTGASATIAPGRDGEAFAFDGTSFIEVPDAPLLNPTVGLTLAAWVYVTGGTTYLDIVGKDGETESRQYLLGVSKHWRFRPHIGTVERLRYFDGSTPIENNRWYHVAMTYDVPTGELVVFVNGEPDGSQVVPEGRRCISVTSQAVRIGGGAPEGRAQLPFYGRIDDVRIYDRALTRDQIRQLHALQEPDVPPLGHGEHGVAARADGGVP